MRRPLPTLAAVLLATAPAGIASADGAEGRHPVAAQVAGQLADPEKPFVMLVEFSVPADKSEAFVEAVLAARRQTIKEPGNVAYQLVRGVKDPTRFVLYERWKSVAALDAHLKQPYLVELLTRFGELLPAGPKVTVMTPVARPGWGVER